MLTVLLSACSESESPSPEEPSGLSLLPVVETNPSPAPVINLVVSEFRVGEQRALDLSSEVSSGEAWQITDVLSVTGPVRVALLSATELEVIADGAGMADVTYRVESGGNIYQGYMAIAVSSPVNTSPSAADIQLISNGTAKLEIDLSRYISDRDGDELTVTDLLQSDERFAVDGHILTYHANGFVGIDSATYIVTDDKGGWAAGLIQVTVTDNTPPPATLSVSTLVQEMTTGQSVTLDISSAVTASDSWQISQVSVDGTAVDADIGSNSELTLNALAEGVAEVSVEVTSSTLIATGLIVVAVSDGDNTSPFANDVTLSTDSDTDISIPLSSYIGDADGDTVSVDSLVQVSDRFSLSGGTVEYRPNGFVGIDSATYIVTDGKGGWAAGLIQVTVTDNSPPPATLSVSTLVQEMTTGQSVTLDISSAVTASDSWQISQVTPSNSAVSAAIASDNEIALTAQAAGVTEVVYTLVSSGVVATGTLVVAVSDLDNNLPYANDLNSSTDSLTNLTISLNGAYGDVDGDAVSVTELLQADSRFALSGELVTYSPGGFIGVDTATYLVSDGRGGMAAGLLVVNVTDASPAPDNTSPTAADYSFSTDSATQVTLDLAALGLVADADSDPLSIAIFGGDSRVAVSGLTLEYTPGGYVGADEFVYQVSDGKGGSALGHISATVSDATPANQVPTAAATTLTLTLQQIQASSQRVIDLAGLVSDADGDSLSVTQAYGALGSVTISGTLELTYTASASIPADSFSYVVSDGKGGFAQGTINVSIDNQAPVVQPITLAIDPYAGGSLSIDLSLYTSDADGDSLTLSELGSATAPATISSTGLQLEYTPNGFTGTDSISYSVTDGLATASNVIQITSSSQAVLTANNVSLGSFPLSLGLLVIDMTPFVSNSSGRSISFSNVYGASLGTTSFNNSDLLLRYTPDNIRYGTDSIFYEVTDGEGNTATATVTLTLSAPVAPVITSLTLDYQGDVTASLTCTGCDHPARTEFHFEVAGVPVSGSGAVYSPSGDDKEKTISVRARVKNQYCNADDSGVNGSNACLITEGQVVIQPKYVADVINGEYSHAALMTDGTVVSWGDDSKGADSSAVQAQLTNVVSIANTNWAYAAIKDDGTVVAWGHNSLGGDASAVQADLTDVTKVFANTVAFAALKSDGSLVTWGSGGSGGNSSGVQAQLTNVAEVFGTDTAFAALKSDGTVVTWGDSSNGGDSSAVAADLTNVDSISATRFAFAALKEDGSVVAWGNSLQGGDASSVQADLTNVARIYGNWRAFAAVKDDGSVVTWGNVSFGGDSSGVQADLSGVESISNTTHTFAALKSDNTVVTWGSASLGGDSSSVQAQLTNVESLSATLFAYAALKGDDTVVTWGLAASGGDSSGVQSDLAGVEQIIATEEAFLALKSDNSVVTWGDSDFGGDSSGVSSDFDTVTKVWSNSSSFVAQNQDGTIVTWGDSVEGGDSSAVQSDFTGYSQIFIDLDL
ncbi:cadherin-like domain-containing protein [Shewanella corallii]|uniref:Cadherin-like domain-containing protein n=1 Tax=Shewanella corallii TaxID=560080 RepID=A0ABT0N623_9GAMM|nr:cadherin-like domain-containing protein [Shewanella corallii]MCL2913887.1 cadherin-like domain-containing protein [Shewanella corallii]